MLISYPLLKKEIYLKTGGDHGGGSFKMSFQVANVDNPNHKDNTVVFRIFEAKDHHANIKLALEHFKIQVKELQESTWHIYISIF